MFLLQMSAKFNALSSVPKILKMIFFSPDCDANVTFPDLSGLACSDNRTLNFFAVDLSSQNGLYRSLGLEGQGPIL
jgi:hypothetical protein